MAATVELALLANQLSRAPIPGGRAMHAELAALLRFGSSPENNGGPHLDVETAAGGGASRLVSLLEHIPHCRGEVRTQDLAHPRVRVHHRDVAALSRDLGLVSRAGSPVRGLPPWLVAAAGADADIAAAALRGAVLAAGRLISTEKRDAALSIAAGCLPSAVAVRGLVRRAGASGVLRDNGNGPDAVHSVAVRKRDGLGAALAAMGAADFAAHSFTG